MKSLLTRATVTTLALATTLTAATPLEQAAAALKAGDLAAAESLLTPLATAATPDAAAVHQLGIVRLQQGRLKESVELAEQAVKLDPTKPDHHSQLGAALAQRMGELNFMQQAMAAGRMKQAFAAALERDARHLGALIGMARWYASAPEFAGGSLEKSREFATRVREVHPLMGELELARVAERADDWTTAVTHYEAAAAIRPDHAPTLANLGRALAKLGRTAEARTHLETALRLAPDHEPARTTLATLN